MNFISLYCGADNLGDGIVQTGGSLKLAIDNNSDCCETVKLNNPDAEVICGKVGDYIESLPEVDAVVGGPPCPEFSRAKTNRTFDMCEVNNFWKAVELVKPKHYFMENVQDIKKKLYKGSYLVNCANYGVPQTRKRRIFTDLSLPSPTHTENPQDNLFGRPLKKWVSVREALNLDALIIDGKFNHAERKNSGSYHTSEQPSKTIDTSPREIVIEDRKTTFGEVTKNNTKYRQYSINKPSFTLLSGARPFFVSIDGFKGCNQKEKTRSVDEPSQTILTSKTVQLTNYKIYSLKHLEDKKHTKKHPPQKLQNPSNTITVGGAHDSSQYVTDGKYARKLENEELAVLQGFRKDFKFYGNKTSVRKQIGNALPSAITKAFFSQILT